MTVSMSRTTGRMAAIGLLVVGLGATGCTAKYEQFLAERDREILALKEDKSRLQAEARTLRSAESGVAQRVNDLKRENDELQRALADARTQPAPESDALHLHGGPDAAALKSVASQHGLEVQERAEGLALVLPSTITFRSGSSDLTKSGQNVLVSLAKTLRAKFSGRTISIEGHTDSQPIRRSKFGTNWRLSTERAESVRSFLSKQGLGGKGRVRVVGYGPTAPVSSNAKEAGRKKNRRVEVVILNT